MSIDSRAESDRLATRRDVGLVAIALSIAAHLSVGLALIAIWAPPELLSSTKRREVVPTVIDVLDEPGSSEAIADVSDKEDENLAQGPQGSKESPEEVPPKATALPSPAPRSQPPAAATQSEPHAKLPLPRSSSAAASAGPAAAGSVGTSAAGDPDAGGGEKRPELPSVMARFTHDLAQFASGVPAWQHAPIGDAGSIVVTIAVGDDGKLDKLHDPFAGEAANLSQVLVESVTRTKSALVTKMSSRNVMVKFKVGAVVSDVPVPEGEALSLSFDRYDAKTKKGGSTFVLGSGRQVTFSVEVLETRALTAPP